MRLGQNPGNQSSGISRRRLLKLAAVVSGGVFIGGIAWHLRPAPDHDQPRMTASEAFSRAAAHEITLVDIRTPREWRSTGVPVGSVQLDMRREDFVRSLARAVNGDRAAPIALICARGVRSARMVRALSEAGFSQILDVPEGMLGSRAGPGWIAGNLPVARWQG